MSVPPLALAAGGTQLGPLLDTVLEALREGTMVRGGPLPAGGPEAVAARIRAAVGDVLSRQGDPDALRTLVRAFAAGSAAALHETLTRLHGPVLGTVTAGTTDAGLIDPLTDLADVCAAHGTRLHIDTTAWPSSGGPHPTAASGSRPPPSTPTRSPATWPHF